MSTFIEIVKDSVINDEENTYLLEIECTPQNLSKIVCLDINILNELETERTLCAPLKTIDTISTEFREDIKKGLDDLKVQINHSSTMFTKQHKKKLESLAEEIATEYADAPQEDKDDINKDIKKITEFHQEKMEIISESFKVEQLYQIINVIKEQGKLLKTFNQQVIARSEEKAKQSEKLIEDLKQLNQDYAGKINELQTDLNKKQLLITQKQEEQSRYDTQILQQQKQQNYKQQQIEQQNNQIWYENQNFNEQQTNQKLDSFNQQSRTLKNFLNDEVYKKINMETKIENQLQQKIQNESDIHLLKNYRTNDYYMKQEIELKISALQQKLQSNSENYKLLSQENNQMQTTIEGIQTSIKQNQRQTEDLEYKKSNYLQHITSYQSALSQLRTEVKNIQIDINNTNQCIQNCKNEITVNRKLATELESIIKSEKDTQKSENKKIQTDLRNIEEEIPKLKKLVTPVKVLDSLNLIIICLERFNEAQLNTKTAFMSHHLTIKQTFLELEDHQSALEESTTRRKVNKMAETLKQINESLNDGYESLTTNFKQIDELSNISKQIQYVQSLQQIKN